ncbi:MAG: FtsH protease activity modulator HflK [Pseudomonadota bacterium]
MPWSNQGGGGWRGGNGGPWGNTPQGPNGSGGGGGSGQTPDLEEILRRSQDRIKNIIPGGGGGGAGGGGGFGPKTMVLGALVLLAVWAATGIYRVQPDEQGVVLRFGAFTETTPPGLNYHLPWPIETVLTPRVTTQNQINIGITTSVDGRGPAGRDVPEESLMLTGDENIVDIDFSVIWQISQAENYLFNVQNPEAAVKAVAESAMREVVGRQNLQSVLTEREQTEIAVLELMQETLDTYEAGILVTSVNMQQTDPPSAVIDAFRDVQAARADEERAVNEAQAYANRVVPQARGEAARIVEEANAYRDRTIAEAEGQADRFVKVYDEYALAPDVTRQRLFLETMEQVFRDMDKVIIDDAVGGGVVPYLPLNELNNRRAGGD